MARTSKIKTWIASFPSFEEGKKAFEELWEKGGESRKSLVELLEYANEGAAYVAARNNGLLPGGPMTSNKGDVDKAPRAKRVRGCLPIEVEKWAVLSAQADFIRDGNDEDDFIIPEVTPEFFFTLRAVRNQTKAFEKILTRIGGIDSDAGKALRAWAGKPLTREQEQKEENYKTNKVTSQVDNQIFLMANSASKAVRAVIFSLFADETCLDRRLNGGFLPFC